MMGKVCLMYLYCDSICYACIPPEVVFMFVTQCGGKGDE